MMTTKTLLGWLGVGVCLAGGGRALAQEAIVTTNEAAVRALALAPEGAGAQVADFFTGLTGEWGRQTLLGVETWRYVALFVILVLSILLGRMIRWLFTTRVVRWAARTRFEGDDLLARAAGDPAALAVQSIGWYLAALPLLARMSERLSNLAWRAALVVFVSAIIWFLYRSVEVLDHYLRRHAQRTDTVMDDAVVDAIRKTVRVCLVAVGVMFIGQNILNLNITTLLASAGILGLAVAFAAKDTISNLFGTVMLLMDRPFKVGERVVLDTADGVVESIGFRSTRIRTLDGHLVSLPNKITADTRIQNIGRRPHIRWLTNLALPYDTPAAKVEKALAIVRGILANHEGMHLDFPPRVHFNQFNEWSLNLLVVAWYHPANYWDYLAWCERTNLQIMRAFEAEGIEFAYPTSTTYLARDPKRYDRPGRPGMGPVDGAGPHAAAR